MSDADTILRELVELHRKIGRPGGVGREFSAQHDAAYAAAYAWADAQKAPQPRTAPERPVGWVATHVSGRVLHLGEADGWKVDVALTIDEPPWSKPMGLHVPAAPQPRTAEPTRLRDAIVWALGAGGEFRTQGTMDGPYWWRGELATRAGLVWDGEKYADAEPAPAPAEEPPPLPAYKPMPEDAAERAQWDQSVSIIGQGDVRLAIAGCLRIWAKMSPQGSYREQCAIMANEVAKLYTADQMRARDACWIAKLQAERSK
jgi:hypothetical protein